MTDTINTHKKILVLKDSLVVASSICQTWQMGVSYSNVHFNNIQVWQVLVKTLIKEMFCIMRDLVTFDMSFLDFMQGNKKLVWLEC